MPHFLNSVHGLYKYGAPYPFQKRVQVLQDFRSTGSVFQTAFLNRVDPSTVRKYRFEENGNIQPTYRQANHRAKTLQPYMEVFLEMLLMLNPRLTLSELRARLRLYLQLEDYELPSKTTIHRALRAMNFSRKKCQKISARRFSEENLIRREAYIAWLQTIDPASVYFLDETAVHLNDDERTHGYGYRGSPIAVLSEQNNGQVEKWSVWSVIGYDGVLNAIPIPGNYNTLLFNQALCDFVLDHLPDNSFLVMDNASIHNDIDILELIDNGHRRITLVKLPPYSPDLNPIEMCFGFMKSMLRKNPGHLRIDTRQAIMNAFLQLTPRHTRGAYVSTWNVDQ